MAYRLCHLSGRSDMHAREVPNGETAVASFDIFDTVLTRRVGEPRAAFLLLGRQLERRGLLPCSPEAFARHRRDCEARCFKNAGGLDSTVSLDAIYRELATSLGLKPLATIALHEAELALETTLLEPVPAGVALVDAARNRGEQVIFVSDMYLSSRFLKELLEAHGICRPDEPVFVSNEFAKSKARGTLWNEVAQALQVDLGTIHHVGNDERSDVRSAKRAGLTATHLAEGNLNRFETELERWSFHTDGLTSLLAGASRTSRLQQMPANEHITALRNVAAGVVAPYVIGNALWILRRAIDEQVDTIYFVARDGQVVLDIARKLAPKVGFHGELRYLYGSRQAWTVPAIVQIDQGLVETLAPETGDVDEITIRSIAHRVNLEPEAIADSLHAGGFPASSWETPLTSADCVRLQELILRDKTIHEVILEAAGHQRKRMLGYLDQEGLLTDNRIAFVDQGTGATLFNSLSQVLATVGQEPPLAFYFGMRSNVRDRGFGRPEAYVFDDNGPSGLGRVPGLLTLVEVACTADHGSVLGYEQRGERIDPLLASTSNQAVEDWGFDIVRDTACRVAEALDERLLAELPAVDLRPAIRSVFEAFWLHPTAPEARAWGAYPFEDGWGPDAVSLTLAGRQSLGEAFRSQPHRHWWRAGARTLSSPVPRALLRSREEILPLARKAKRQLAEGGPRSMASALLRR